MIKVQFASLTGKFRTEREEEFATFTEADAAVKEHARQGGYTNVKLADDPDFDSLRWTAKTPGGRSGRNVAHADVYDDDSAH